MRRRISKMLAAFLVITMFITMVPAMNTYAATKKAKVTYTLKKGTLTIKGRGAMPKSMTFYKNKKVKKVVIKKGVTSISNNAFYKCKNIKSVTIPASVKTIGWNSFGGTAVSKIKIPSSVKYIGQNAFANCGKLKKVIMPGNFRLKMKNGDDASQNIMWGTNIDTIQFNTPLAIKNVSYLLADNLVTSEKDEAYKSINGVIYTKDGRGIVRVPSARKELIIENGCRDFNLSAVTYAAYDIDSDPAGGCEVLEKIVIPESVESINDTNYKGVAERALECKNLEIKTKNLSGKSIDVLAKSYYGEHIEYILNVLAKQLPEQVSFKNDIYATNDGVFLKYIGENKEVKIDDNIKIIAEGAFEYCDKTEKIELPESLDIISKNAFYAAYHLKEITIPKNVQVIGDRAFAYCGELKEVIIPDNVKTIGKEAFVCSGLKKAVLPDSITVISEGMFAGCGALSEINMSDKVTVIEKRAFRECKSLNIENIVNKTNIKEIQDYAFYMTEWSSLIIPENIQSIGEGAFACEEGAILKTVTVEGSTKKIDGNAFSPYGIKVTFKRGIKAARPSLHLHKVTRKKGYSTLSINWMKIAGVSGYKVKVSTDKSFKKNTKSVYVSSIRTAATVKMKTGKKRAYIKIIPYKKIDGKKVYGKWSTIQWL